MTIAYMRPQPLIAVRDVEASSRWYQRLLGCKSGHGGPEYEQLVFEGELLLQLHAWDVEDDQHRHMGSPKIKSRGNGVLLWFQVDDFDAAVARARGLRAEILEAPHVNPNANHRECWLRDPDGYVVVLASRHGDTEPARNAG
jgi:catechol 2,3-dioxygenase-like lactoylglutathione lyase family enzyme